MCLCTSKPPATKLSEKVYFSIKVTVKVTIPLFSMSFEKGISSGVCISNMKSYLSYLSKSIGKVKLDVQTNRQEKLCITTANSKATCIYIRSDTMCCRDDPPVTNHTGTTEVTFGGTTQHAHNEGPRARFDFITVDNAQWRRIESWAGTTF